MLQSFTILQTIEDSDCLLECCGLFGVILSVLHTTRQELKDGTKTQ